MIPERKQVDSDIADIRVFMQKIDSYMENSTKPLKQVWDNKDDITKLKTKQGLVQWIGGTVFMGIIIYISKGHWYKH